MKSLTIKSLLEKVSSVKLGAFGNIDLPPAEAPVMFIKQWRCTSSALLTSNEALHTELETGNLWLGTARTSGADVAWYVEFQQPAYVTEFRYLVFINPLILRY